MYYYLGIVKEKDVLAGRFDPSYVLCKSEGKSQNRAPWRITNPAGVYGTVPKVLVKTLVGHENDMMIDFMSNYRTREKMYNKHSRRSKKMLKRTVRGALFWFPCDINGTQKGPALFIKHVPDKSVSHYVDQGFTRLKESLARQITLKEVLSREPAFIDNTASHVKPKLWQRDVRPQRRTKRNCNTSGLIKFTKTKGNENNADS